MQNKADIVSGTPVLDRIAQMRISFRNIYDEFPSLLLMTGELWDKLESEIDKRTCCTMESGIIREGRDMIIVADKKNKKKKYESRFNLKRVYQTLTNSPGGETP